MSVGRPWVTLRARVYDPAAMYLEQLPSGSWRATVRHRGQRVRGTGRTRDEALFRLAEKLTRAGLNPAAGAGTVDELLNLHLTACAAELAPTTLDDYRRIVARLREAAPPLLELQVCDVEPVQVRAVYRALAAAGWSDHRVDRAHDVLSGAFRRAVVELGWIRTNPAAGAGPDPADVAVLEVPSDDDVLAIIDACSTPLLAIAVRIAATIGTRRGETVALQWRDVDLDAGRVTVCRSLSYTPASGVTERLTKTGPKGHRRVTIRSPKLIADLRRHRAQQAALALENGLPAPVWVCSDDAGVTPWRPDRFTHEFDRARKAAGVGWRLQDLRHYCATTLLTDGVAPAIVAGILGHTSTDTTLRRYAHYIPGVDGQAAAIMASRLG